MKRTSLFCVLLAYSFVVASSTASPIAAADGGAFRGAKLSSGYCEFYSDSNPLASVAPTPAKRTSAGSAVFLQPQTSAPKWNFAYAPKIVHRVGSQRQHFSPILFQKYEQTINFANQHFETGASGTARRLLVASLRSQNSLLQVAKLDLMLRERIEVVQSDLELAGRELADIVAGLATAEVSGTSVAKVSAARVSILQQFAEADLLDLLAVRLPAQILQQLEPLRHFARRLAENVNSAGNDWF